MKSYGVPGKKSDGTLTWDAFLYINKTTLRFLEEITRDKVEEFATKRRALLKEGKHEEYDALAIESTSYNLEIRNNLVQIMYALLEIDK